MTSICDVCGKERKIYRHGPEGIGVCFLCVKEGERAAVKWEEQQYQREQELDALRRHVAALPDDPFADLPGALG